jgi:hypothetical protein
MDKEFGRVQEVLAASIVDDPPESVREEILAIGGSAFVSEVALRWMTTA